MSYQYPPSTGGSSGSKDEKGKGKGQGNSEGKKKGKSDKDQDNISLSTLKASDDASTKGMKGGSSKASSTRS